MDDEDSRRRRCPLPPSHSLWLARSLTHSLTGQQVVYEYLCRHQAHATWAARTSCWPTKPTPSPRAQRLSHSLSVRLGPMVPLLGRLPLSASHTLPPIPPSTLFLSLSLSLCLRGPRLHSLCSTACTPTALLIEADATSSQLAPARRARTSDIRRRRASTSCLSSAALPHSAVSWSSPSQVPDTTTVSSRCSPSA